MPHTPPQEAHVQLCERALYHFHLLTDASLRLYVQCVALLKQTSEQVCLLEHRLTPGGRFTRL